MRILNRIFIFIFIFVKKAVHLRVDLGRKRDVIMQSWIAAPAVTLKLQVVVIYNKLHRFFSFTNNNPSKSALNPSCEPSHSQRVAIYNPQRIPVSPPNSTRDLRASSPGRLADADADEDDDMPSKTPHTNGSTDPVENGVNGTKDVEMKDDAPAPLKGGKAKKVKEGEEEMTVVVPPSKGQKLSGVGKKDDEGDVAMDVEEPAEEEDGAEKVDPVAKAVAGTCFPFASSPLVH